MYEYFEVEDFLRDEYFINSIKAPTKETILFWNNWQQEHPEQLSIFQTATYIVQNIDVKGDVPELQADELNSIINFVKINAFQREDTSYLSSKHNYFKWLVAAACILLISSIGIYIYNVQRPLKVDNSVANVMHNVSNNSKESMLIKLEDNTIVLLRPRSSLQFPMHFSSKERQVFLKGEAFFEVHKDSAHPFLVYSKYMVTRVLGTSFTVNAFDSATFKVTVNTGKVLVYKKEKTELPKASITLLPNQEATYMLKNELLEKKTLATPSVLSKEVATNKFTFKNTPISTIINELDSAYSIKVKYDKNKIGDEILTASLAELPLDEKIKFICKAINASWSIQEGKIEIITP